MAADSINIQLTLHAQTERNIGRTKPPLQTRTLLRNVPFTATIEHVTRQAWSRAKQQGHS
eukprot:237399-Lingulodinium_polyedra.AAC.1